MLFLMSSRTHLVVIKVHLGVDREASFFLQKVAKHNHNIFFNNCCCSFPLRFDHKTTILCEWWCILKICRYEMGWKRNLLLSTLFNHFAMNIATFICLVWVMCWSYNRDRTCKFLWPYFMSKNDTFIATINRFLFTFSSVWIFPSLVK